MLYYGLCVKEVFLFLEIPGGEIAAEFLQDIFVQTEEKSGTNRRNKLGSLAQIFAFFLQTRLLSLSCGGVQLFARISKMLL